MTRPRSSWRVLDTRAAPGVRRIVFLQDASADTGGCTITNDAEDVLAFFYPARVVYQDTRGDWSEIVGVRDDVKFVPWHGEAWDILKSGRGSGRAADSDGQPGIR